MELPAFRLYWGSCHGSGIVPLYSGRRDCSGCRVLVISLAVKSPSGCRIVGYFVPPSLSWFGVVARRSQMMQPDQMAPPVCAAAGPFDTQDSRDVMAS